MARVSADIIRVIPQAAELYRAAVRNLSGTLTDRDDREKARLLIAGLLGGEVKVRQEGAAVYARVAMDSGVLLSV